MSASSFSHARQAADVDAARAAGRRDSSPPRSRSWALPCTASMPAVAHARHRSTRPPTSCGSGVDDARHCAASTASPRALGRLPVYLEHVEGLPTSSISAGVEEQAAAMRRRACVDVSRRPRAARGVQRPPVLAALGLAPARPSRDGGTTSTPPPLSCLVENSCSSSCAVIVGATRRSQRLALGRRSRRTRCRVTDDDDRVDDELACDR